MTSSLVGSEMCIRDSVDRVGGLHRQQQGTGGRIQRSIEQRPGGSVAVSYTHLTLPTICSV
eukprot:10801249-Prorocentrum_lima.AAC.1